MKVATVPRTRTAVARTIQQMVTQSDGHFVQRHD